MTIHPTRSFVLFVAGAFGLIALLVVLSLVVGANMIAPTVLLDTLTGGGTEESRFILLDQRVPRTVAALVAGAGLGGAGALIQAVTRNPLADPGILGVNAGAAAAVAGAIVFLGVASPGQYVWFAYAGAFVLTAAAFLLGSAGPRRADPLTLTVAGLAVGAVLSGLTTGLTLTNPDAFERMLGWSAGSLLGRGFDVTTPVLLPLVVGIALALAIAAALNAMALGDDVAAGQGVRVPRTRLLAVVAITLLAGTATAVAGPISFVGLMVPHVVRWIVGVDQRRIIAGSIVAAPALVLASDIVGRLVALPAEMPVGIVTAFVGAPVLVLLVRRNRRVTGL
ncbi:iron chelate uptake ABC transporter family permease subunit [Agreia sp. Leaf335]|uniref:iron chelate uptake ABC transporter family permease subunit n=1 Tax=Agreia sp. Leaf335 TaxID=1736340 RepID=UPI000B005254|nr:iron chelate uptake ABC transporter family permease subunit [Agreia sp. Leaf335]